MLENDRVEFRRLIEKLRRLGQEAYEMSLEIPAARTNLYLILRRIEMLEIEVSDPIEVLSREPSSEADS